MAAIRCSWSKVSKFEQRKPEGFTIDHTAGDSQYLDTDIGQTWLILFETHPNTMVIACRALMGPKTYMGDACSNIKGSDQTQSRVTQG